MKKFQNISIILIFLITITLDSQTAKRESYIDIPSAHLTKGLFINLNGSFPTGSENEVSTDVNSGLEFALNRFNILLNWYSTSNFSLDLSYLLLEQNEKVILKILMQMKGMILDLQRLSQLISLLPENLVKISK
jgi:hypothetical protein